MTRRETILFPVPSKKSRADETVSFSLFFFFLIRFSHSASSNFLLQCRNHLLQEVSDV